MTIGLNKEATRCSMLPDGDEARQEQENGTKNPISGDGSGVPAVVFGRRGLSAQQEAPMAAFQTVLGLATPAEGPTCAELYAAGPSGRWKHSNS